MNTSSRKVAIFRYPGPDGYESPFFVTGDAMEFGGTLRVSEPVTVEFTMLAPEQSVAAEISILDKRIAAVTEKFAQELDALKSRKQELLAITHDDSAELDERADCVVHGLQDGPDCVRC